MKKLIVFLTLSVLVIAVFFISLKTKNNQSKGYIITEEADITIEDVNEFRAVKSIDFFTKKEPDPDSVVTPTTLKLFKQIQHLFRKSKDMDTHYEDVLAWLYSQYPEDVANQLIEIYKTFLTCETDLFSEYKNWGSGSTPEEILALLEKVQDFRRDRLGVDVADILFGVDVKTREYSIRKGSILNNNDLYGAEKERLIASINEEMWGDESNSSDFETNGFNNYREKMALYMKDLSEIESDEERQVKITEFREMYFTPDVVEKFEKIDQKIASEREIKNQYYSAENEILNTDDLTHEEKSEKILALQNDIFGEQADGFRRLQAMRKGLDKLKNN